MDIRPILADSALFPNPYEINPPFWAAFPMIVLSSLEKIILLLIFTFTTATSSNSCLAYLKECVHVAVHLDHGTVTVCFNISWRRPCAVMGFLYTSVTL